MPEPGLVKSAAPAYLTALQVAPDPSGGGRWRQRRGPRWPAPALHRARRR